MSREILFRAKRVNWRELLKEGWWVEGNLVLTDDSDEEYRAIIIPKEKSNMFLDSKENDLGFEAWYLIDPETVCENTSLTDKNGRKIFEGDIVKRTLLPTKRIENYFRVSFVSLKSCFSAIDLNGTNVTFISDYINKNYEIEVIGNIFDNPELLKGCD